MAVYEEEYAEHILDAPKSKTAFLPAQGPKEAQDEEGVGEESVVLMQIDSMKRCPHYQIYSEPLKTPGAVAYLAVRRCTLTERAIRLLDRSEEGTQLGERLMIHMQNGKRFAFVGMDMEPVTQQTCDNKRCEGHCTPAYESILHGFGIVDPQEEAVTCKEEDASLPHSPISPSLPA